MGPPEALEAYRSVVAESRSGAEVKGAKNPYTSRNGHMFSFLDADGTMALRLSDELTEEFRSWEWIGTLPDQAQGALLFADDSGPRRRLRASPICSVRLAEPMRSPSLIYSKLIDEVHQLHGRVIGFAGVAITCWFDGCVTITTAES